MFLQRAMQFGLPSGWLVEGDTLYTKNKVNGIKTSVMKLRRDTRHGIPSSVPGCAYRHSSHSSEDCPDLLYQMFTYRALPHGWRIEGNGINVKYGSGATARVATLVKIESATPQLYPPLDPVYQIHAHVSPIAPIAPIAPVRSAPVRVVQTPVRVVQTPVRVVTPTSNPFGYYVPVGYQPQPHYHRDNDRRESNSHRESHSRREVPRQVTFSTDSDREVEAVYGRSQLNRSGQTGQTGSGRSGVPRKVTFGDFDFDLDF